MGITARLFLSLALLLALQACKHPLAIVGEGDIVDMNGDIYGCTLEQFQASDPACTGFDFTEDYLVNYKAVPRPGWQFSRWEGPCKPESIIPYCLLTAPLGFSQAMDDQFPGVLMPTTTAVFEEIVTLTVTPVLDTPRRVAVMVDTEGGTVEATSGEGLVYSLDIPAGALLEGTEIVVTPVSGIPDLPHVDRFLAAVQFEPSGLLLAQSATLTLDLPDDVDPTKLVAIGWNGVGTHTHLEPISGTINQLSFVVSHFSGIGVVEGQADAMGEIAEPYAPHPEISLMETRFKNQLALDITHLLNEQCGGYFDANCLVVDEIKDIVLEVTQAWLFALTDIMTTNQTLSVDQMLDAFFSWEGFTRSELCGASNDCEVFDNAFLEYLQPLREAIAYAWLSLFEDARDRYWDGEVSRLTTKIDLLGSTGWPEAFITAFQLPPGAELEQKLRDLYGSQLLIDTQDFPSKLFAGGDPVEFSVTVSQIPRGGGTAGAVLSTDVTIDTDNNEGNAEGCGSVRGGPFETDENSVVVGEIQNDDLRLKPAVEAAEWCTEEDKVVVYITVDGLPTDGVDHPLYHLGKTIRLEAEHEPARLKITDSFWFADLYVSHECDAENCSFDKDKSETGTFPSTNTSSVAVSVSSGQGHAASSTSSELRVDTTPANGDSLDVHWDAQVLIGARVGVNSSSNGWATTKARVQFEVLDNPLSYTATWNKIGFEAAASAEGAFSLAEITFKNLDTGTTLISTDTEGNEDNFSLSGTLDPGHYYLQLICDVYLSDWDRNVASGSYSDSGQCILDFDVD